VPFRPDRRGGSLATIASMDPTWTRARIAAHVTALADEIGPRPSGSPANRLATDYLRMVLRAADVVVDEQPFSCRWWEPGGASVQIGGAWFDVPPAPFSRPADVRGRVTRLADDAALAAAGPRPGRVVVIDGDLTRESYLPRAFPFQDRPDQRARLARLESLQPEAVIAVVPAWRVAPILEDADLAFPYVAVGTHVADRLREDREVAVRIGGALHHGDGVNLSVRVGGDGPRLVLSAHVDTKITSPGAFDDAGGVATLLALIEAGSPPDVALELVFFNGEDHCEAPGEQAWLAARDLREVAGAVNLDGAGVAGHPTAVTLMAGTPDLERTLRAALAGRAEWGLGPPWYESDHAMFVTRGIPSLAITSAGAHDLANVIHAERDTPRLVDPAILADVADFVERWVGLARSR
jgi:aminopeptidase YwaD